MNFEEKIDKAQGKWLKILDTIPMADIEEKNWAAIFNSFFKHQILPDGNRKEYLEVDIFNRIKEYPELALLLYLCPTNHYREYLEECKLMLIEKNKQYGDAVLNPVYFLITPDDRELNIKVQINNKLNRMMNQTDNEDSEMDCLNYFCFLRMLEI